ncbi:MAG: hypothetical protein KatS3mg113_0819 [Planctomycetaceae bacterium]|nr:MAG: hypothetical protein KatS3mg113_0819 [Planctomycetaceae bacterium]
MFLLKLLPVFTVQCGLALTLVFGQLPIIWSTRGRKLRGSVPGFHEPRGGGRPAGVDPTATCGMHSLGVGRRFWSALYIAWALEPSAGLVAGYLAIVNAVFHVVPAVARREYNPGLVTAVLWFVPVGGWCVAQVGSEGRNGASRGRACRGCGFACFGRHSSGVAACPAVQGTPRTTLGLAELSYTHTFSPVPWQSAAAED